MDLTIILISLCIGLIAYLYSSVGHAGASGYIAIMSLAGVAETVIKPTALLLNICVSLIASYQFIRAGHFSWKLFWPFALASAPLAFLGGYINLPTQIFRIIIGLVLLYSALRFFAKSKEAETVLAPSVPAQVLSGGIIGLISGLTGTGGGIFLTPLLLFKRWSKTKVASGVSALFILVNSVTGLAGNYSSTRHLPGVAFVFLASALVGGTLGSYMGSRKFSPEVIKKMLAVVLLIAGLKLLFS
jgi:uncharacterized protein